MDDKQIAHLGFIQGAINRMAGNSLAVKGAAIALTTAVVTVIAVVSKFSCAFLIAAIIPIALFWLLDTKYLKLERQYRKLYDAVRKSDKTDFSMNSELYSENVQSFFRTAISWSVVWFYVVLLTMIAGSAYIV